MPFGRLPVAFVPIWQEPEKTVAFGGATASGGGAAEKESEAGTGTGRWGRVFPIKYRVFSTTDDGLVSCTGTAPAFKKPDILSGIFRESRWAIYRNCGESVPG